MPTGNEKIPDTTETRAANAKTTASLALARLRRYEGQHRTLDTYGNVDPDLISYEAVLASIPRAIELAHI